MNDVFQSLRQILQRHAAELKVVRDISSEYYLDSKVDEKGKPIFFGMVKLQKAKVSFHLMPVYIYPDLLAEISDDLRKRMQGKSCFNFSKVDPVLFKELEILTDRGIEYFRKTGRI